MGYAIALFLHLLFVLTATAAASVTTFAALRLRHVDSAPEAIRGLALVERTVRAFPVSVVGLLATGGYMTHQRWAWSIPWVDAALAGLALIVFLGSGIEASRGRAVRREIEDSGLSQRARRLLRDPLAWSAKMTTLTLVVAAVFVMTVKPGPRGCAAALLVAAAVGVLLAIPLWRTTGAEAPELAREPSS